jgi:2-polyprenyl-3-methyl-5-hydroxy-6-metoxy-1,4-benzoquinol methylase
VDPRAPAGDTYRTVEFERFEPAAPADAVVASTSLHHVADPGDVVDRIAAMLAPGGVAVVIEWDWKRFDEPTAAWAFERLGGDGVGGWLHGHRDRWQASGRPWEDYLRAWARQHGIHPAATLLGLLDERLERRAFARRPYLFTDLAGADEADERAAIEAGLIRATRIDYVGLAR